MTCKACGAAAALETCLFCGHGVCSSHRGAVDGAPACTPCLEAEHARRRRAGTSGRAGGEGAPGGAAAWASDRLAAPAPAGASDRLGAAPAPLPPLPEPGAGGLAALTWAAAAAAPTLLYLRWLASRLDPSHEAVPAGLVTAGVGAGAALVFGAVWVIARSKLAR